MLTVTTFERPTLVITSNVNPELFSAIVRAGTLSPATHAAIGIGDHFLHVHDAGVVYEPRAAWLRDSRQLAEFLIVPDVSDGLAERFSRVGERYDLLGVIGVIVEYALRKLGSPIRTSRLRSRDAHICAEFVMGLDPTGEKITEWGSIDRALVSPADLLQVATSSKAFQRIA